MSDLENVYKLNTYFYMDSNQNIFIWILTKIFLNIRSIAFYLIVKKCFF